MSVQVQFRRGNTAQTAAFTGAYAEITVDTDKRTAVVHDGVSPGGTTLAREYILRLVHDDANTAQYTANLAYDMANSVSGSGYSYSNTIGAASNSWANTVFGYSNSYTQTVGTAGNNYTVSVGAASNGWANTVVVGANAWTNAIFGYSNTYTQTVGTAGNNYTVSVGAASNGWANIVAAGANAWSNTKVSSITGTAGQIYSSGGTTPTLNLIETGVTTSTYGGASQIPVITVDAYGRLSSASNVAVQGMDYAYANTIGAASNAWTNTVFGYSNTYTQTVGTAGNNYTVTVGAASNGWANTVVAGANAWANTVFGYSNTYTNTVGTAGNNYTVSVGAASNGWANAVSTGANAWTNTVFGYANTSIAAANGWTNTSVAGANAWTNAVFGYANTSIAAANGWANTVVAGANAWVNTSVTGANAWTNTVFGYSNSYTTQAYGQANVALTVANLAFNEANVAYNFPVDIGRSGFLNNTQTSISYSGNNTFFLANTNGGGWDYYLSGVKYHVTGTSSVNLNATNPPPNGTYYIVIQNNGTGTLSSSTSTWNTDDSSTVPVAVVIYNSGSNPTYVVRDARHLVTIDRHMYTFLNSTYPTVAAPFGALSGYTVNPASPTDANNTFAVSSTIVIEEDIYHPAITLTDGNGLVSNNYSVLYRSNATNYLITQSALPFLYQAAGYIQWDNAGTLTQGTNNNYYNTYLLFTALGNKEGFLIVPGRGEFASASAAQAEDPTTFDFTGFPDFEFIFAYQLTWQAKSTHTSTGKVALAVAPRKIAVASAAPVAIPATTVHNQLAGLQGGFDNTELYHLTASEYSTLQANIGVAAYNQSNTIFGVANAAFNTANAANAWTNTVFGYANTSIAAANGWANTVSTGANAWTNTVFGYANTSIAAANGWVNTSVAGANSWTNAVFGYANTSIAAANGWANTVAAGANAWSNTKVSSVTGTAGQIYSSGGTSPTLNLITTAVTAATYGGASQIPVITVDAYGRLTYSANVAVQGMDYAYANTIGAASNGWANTVVAGANGYANTVGTAGNNYTVSVGAASNGWANTVAAGANAWSNTKISSVTGTAGQIYVSTGTSPVLNLITTGVTATTYGNATIIPVLTVDAYGRITAVSNTTSSGGGGGGYYNGNNGEKNASNYGDIFRVHSNTLSTNVTIYSGNNAICGGPLTIATGQTLTIQTGARTAIV